MDIPADQQARIDQLIETQKDEKEKDKDEWIQEGHRKRLHAID